MNVELNEEKKNKKEKNLKRRMVHNLKVQRILKRRRKIHLCKSTFKASRFIFLKHFFFSIQQFGNRKFQKMEIFRIIYFY